ncbi:MAG TPA: hypothetical protein VFU81_05420, partial [Thermomicrobiales bacterium]|nr:hypothetical protein [Thermomicrobiales bacterium]
MADEGEPSGWVSIGKAARTLGVGKSAIRKRIEAGTLASRDDDGSTKVLLPVARPHNADASVKSTPRSDAAEAAAESAISAARMPLDEVAPAASGLVPCEREAADAEMAVRVAALTERATQLAARLAEAHAERDRWLAAAAEARNDARAAVAAR